MPHRDETQPVKTIRELGVRHVGWYRLDWLPRLSALLTSGNWYWCHRTLETLSKLNMSYCWEIVHKFYFIQLFNLRKWILDWSMAMKRRVFDKPMQWQHNISYSRFIWDELTLHIAFCLSTGSDFPLLRFQTHTNSYRLWSRLWHIHLVIEIRSKNFPYIFWSFHLTKMLSILNVSRCPMVLGRCPMVLGRQNQRYFNSCAGLCDVASEMVC